jgi:hypothetical protein
VKRTTVVLHTEEHEALLALAERERRDPRSQAAFLIRRGLEQSGVLSSADIPTQDRRPETQEERHT